MIRKLKNFWTSLDGTAVISKREFFLEITVAALAGLALGMIFTPKKNVALGSYNCGNGNYEYGLNDSEENNADEA